MEKYSLAHYGYEREIMQKSRYRIMVKEVILTKGICDLYLNRQYMFGYYILGGSIKIGGTRYKKDSLVWIKGGTSLETELLSNVHALYFESDHKLEEKFDFDAYIESEMPWSRPAVPGTCTSKHMVAAEDFGMKVQIEMYTKGFTCPWHSHHISHGFYVLDGVLRIRTENQDQLYGPGEWTVNDAETELSHELAPETDYVKYVFFTNGVSDFLVNGVNTRE